MGRALPRLPEVEPIPDGTTFRLDICPFVRSGGYDRVAVFSLAVHLSVVDNLAPVVAIRLCGDDFVALCFGVALCEQTLIRDYR